MTWLVRHPASTWFEGRGKRRPHSSGSGVGIAAMENPSKVTYLVCTSKSKSKSNYVSGAALASLTSILHSPSYSR